MTALELSFCYFLYVLWKAVSVFSWHHTLFHFYLFPNLPIFDTTHNICRLFFGMWNAKLNSVSNTILCIVFLRFNVLFFVAFLPKYRIHFFTFTFLHSSSPLNRTAVVGFNYWEWLYVLLNFVLVFLRDFVWWLMMSPVALRRNLQLMNGLIAHPPEKLFRDIKCFQEEV